MISLSTKDFETLFDKLTVHMPEITTILNVDLISFCDVKNNLFVFSNLSSRPGHPQRLTVLENTV